MVGKPAPRRSLALALAAALLAALLGGCGTLGRSADTTQQQTGEGGSTPESVTKGFFADLGQALKDPALGNEDARDRWVERLAGYFAPNERDSQRVILSDALASFANDRAQLGADETLTLEIRFDEPRRVEQPGRVLQDGDRVLVQLPNASLFMQISRITDRGAFPYYEQPISLDRIIGRSDGSVPTVRIDGRWFLTEG